MMYSIMMIYAMLRKWLQYSYKLIYFRWFRWYCKLPNGLDNELCDGDEDGVPLQRNERLCIQKLILSPISIYYKQGKSSFIVHSNLQQWESMFGPCLIHKCFFLNSEICFRNEILRFSDLWLMTHDSWCTGPLKWTRKPSKTFKNWKTKLFIKNVHSIRIPGIWVNKLESGRSVSHRSDSIIFLFLHRCFVIIYATEI